MAVTLKRVDRVALITLNVPEKLNAMTQALATDFAKVLRVLQDDPSPYGCVVRASVPSSSLPTRSGAPYGCVGEVARCHLTYCCVHIFRAIYPLRDNECRKGVLHILPLPRGVLQL